MFTCFLTTFESNLPGLRVEVENARAWFDSNILQDICCVGDRGNLDNLGDPEQPNVSDLIYIVEFLFRSNIPPLCEREGDIDGSGGITPINISDLTYMVSYMFLGGPPPVPCDL